MSDIYSNIMNMYEYRLEVNGIFSLCSSPLDKKVVLHSLLRCKSERNRNTRKEFRQTNKAKLCYESKNIKVHSESKCRQKKKKKRQLTTRHCKNKIEI